MKGMSGPCGVESGHIRCQLQTTNVNFADKFKESPTSELCFLFFLLHKPQEHKNNQKKMPYRKRVPEFQAVIMAGYGNG